MIAVAFRRVRAGFSGLRADASGLALLEFALSLPIVLGLGLYGVETANLALTNMRVSQIALNLADNAARVGERQSNNSVQLREIDVNDVLAATRIQGERIDLANRGRVILSSLEEQDGNQVIHWQRCLGKKNGTGFDSSYGTTTTTDGTDKTTANDGTIATGGMGDAGSKVTAPDDSGVMFVEINYQYKPIVNTTWLPGGSARIHYIASFIVRDRRVFDQIYNPNPAATRMTCNLYTA
ncbi:histidine kinase [Sphingomonas sp. SUN019]|uniref:TadE/TadG family type IV pilus assembly protein n=1 Tax=Sphingomonas sp. SUN019 TaxID=2937788 RepID=UPI002164AF3A|nr:histidine kinase [Sphingomonas sp. SUN019]UVO52397.1 histidine kinase [Sphingomonas sp. SUN019]